MSIAVGATSIIAAKHGSTNIIKVYNGADLIADFGVAGESSPADISDLDAWWDARDETYLTYSTAAEVEVWNDRHGTNHLTQATASKQADWANDRFGTGLGGLDFDGGDGYPLPFNVASALTMFAVLINDDFTATPYLMGAGVTSNSDNGAAIRCDGSIRGIIGNGTARAFSDSSGTATATIYRAIFRYDATRARMMVNGAEIDNETHSLGSLGTDQMGLGANGAAISERFFNGRLCMAGHYSRYLSDAEAAQLATILGELVP